MDLIKLETNLISKLKFEFIIHTAAWADAQYINQSYCMSIEIAENIYHIDTKFGYPLGTATYWEIAIYSAYNIIFL